VGEHLPSKCKALNSNPSTTQEEGGEEIIYNLSGRNKKSDLVCTCVPIQIKPYIMYIMYIYI
jgi:hypothetical protein